MFSRWENLLRSTGILPVSSRAADIFSAPLVAAALIFLSPGTTSAGVALGNVRQLRPRQSEVANLGRSAQSAQIKALNANLGCAARFVTCIATNGSGRLIAIGTEGQGLFVLQRKRRKPNGANDWIEFDRTTVGGFPANNVYSVCFDSSGRLWAGTLKSGVEVGILRNGIWMWRNYDTIPSDPTAEIDNSVHSRASYAGPVGAHVMAIAEDPVDHSIWMATEDGLSIYYPSGSLGVFRSKKSRIIYRPILAGRWRYVSIADGLPLSPPDCIAFNRNGRVLVGTQCTGIAYANYRKFYTRWHRVAGPMEPTHSPRGIGLPSPLINCIHALPRSHEVLAGTDWGLALSRDSGRDWAYIRGADYLAKSSVRGLPEIPLTSRLGRTLLPGDHVTSIAVGPGRRIGLGFWRNGYACYPSRGTGNAAGPSSGGPYVGALCALGKAVIVGFYGAGVQVIGTLPHVTAIHGSRKNLKFPSPAVGPSGKMRNLILRRLNKAREYGALSRSPATILPEDWKTQGTWLGRYGTYFAILCAMRSPADKNWGAGWYPILYWPLAGPGQNPGDFLRNWVTWDFSADPRSLELPRPVFERDWLDGEVPGRAMDRRQSEWDDHGEAYPFTRRGLGIYCTISVPQGIFQLAIYDFNKDAHVGTDNALRDYFVELRQHPRRLAYNNLRGFRHWPLLATARISGFAGGEWQRFLVRGPLNLTIKVGRNFSFNTILAGVFLSLYQPYPRPFCGPISPDLVALSRTLGPCRGTPPIGFPRGRKKKNKPALTKLNIGDGVTERLVAPAADIMPLSAMGMGWLALRARACQSLLLSRHGKARRAEILKLARLYWWLNRFKRYEILSRRAGRVTPRQIELDLRYDPRLGHPGSKEIQLLSVEFPKLFARRP